MHDMGMASVINEVKAVIKVEDCLLYGKNSYSSVVFFC